MVVIFAEASFDEVVGEGIHTAVIRAAVGIPTDALRGGRERFPGAHVEVDDAVAIKVQRRESRAVKRVAVQNLKHP